jgi:fumarate reductase subunit C
MEGRRVGGTCECVCVCVCVFCVCCVSGEQLLGKRWVIWKGIVSLYRNPTLQLVQMLEIIPTLNKYSSIL